MKYNIQMFFKDMEADTKEIRLSHFKLNENYMRMWINSQCWSDREKIFLDDLSFFLYLLINKQKPLYNSLAIQITNKNKCFAGKLDFSTGFIKLTEVLCKWNVALLA